MRECIHDEMDLEFKLKYNLQWFAKDGEGGEKTEPATAKKLDDARKEGKVAKSKELTAAFDLIVLFLVLKVFISFVGERLIGIFTQIYNKIPEFLEVNRGGLTTVAISSFFMDVIAKWLIIVCPFFIFGVIVTLLVSIYQVGWRISTKPMAPKLSKFNPINGFKRIFSANSLFELLKSVVKITVITLVAYNSIKDHKNELFVLYDLELNQAIALIGNIILDTGLKIGIVYVLTAFFIGMGIITLIDFLIPEYENPHEAPGLSLDSKTPAVGILEQSRNEKALHRLGIMSALAIAIHNFPEGIATFIGALNDPEMGAGLTFAIAIHNIPEGIAIAIPIYYATKSKGKALLYATLSGMSEVLGAILCLGITSILGLELTEGGATFPLVLAAVAGIMIYISLDELLPTAEKYGKHHIAIAGVVGGMAIMAVSLLLI